jgi:hypothetical protein
MLSVLSSVYPIYFQYLFSITLLAYRQIRRFYCFHINCFTLLHTTRLDGSTALFYITAIGFGRIPLLHYFHTAYYASTPLPPWYQSCESYGLLLPLDLVFYFLINLICSLCDLSICPLTFDLSAYLLTLDLSFLCSVFRL